MNSNLGKVLCSILNTRLLHFLMKHNALSKCLMPANVRLKLETKEPNSSPRGRGVRQGCSLSPTLFNIYINQLANILERAPIQGLTLHDTEIKCLLYADDLVLLSPTEEGLQDSLNLLEDFCQSWALTVNLQKTRVMMFQKRSRSQGPAHTFTLAHRTIETTKTYTYSA